jgi:hypothetical protein
VAQADSVPSSSRQLITAESANQSTDPRVNLPAVGLKPANHRYLIGGPHSRVIVGNDQASVPRLRREKRSNEPESLLKCRYHGAEACHLTVGSNIEALYYVKAALFVGWLLRRIVRILLFVRRNKRLRNSALDKVSSNQLVPQERLR